MRFPRSLVAASATALALACGADDPGPVDGGPGGGGFASSGALPEDDPSRAGCVATVAPTEKSKMDVVFVIDNSASMHEEMEQIRANVNRFVERFANSGLDYRVIFIVPKETNPRYPGFCVPPPLGRADCNDNPPRFFHLDQSVGSWESLELLLSTYDGSGSAATPTWKQHLRVESIKVFVVVTDDESRMSADAFDVALRAKAPAGMFGSTKSRNYVFHSIVSKPSAATAPSNDRCATAAGTSVEYQKLSLLTGGIIDEVCKTDYSGVLDALANGIADKVACELEYPREQASDGSLVVVRFTPSGGASTNLTQVTDRSKCNEVENAWYYDDPANPTRIILCPVTCSVATATRASKIEALVGCKAPPPR